LASVKLKNGDSPYTKLNIKETDQQYDTEQDEVFNTSKKPSCNK
jgi:hypothetical protein